MSASGDRPTVVVNDLVALRQRSGVGFYVVELLEAFEAVEPNCDVVPLSQTLAGKPLRWASKIYEGGRSAKSTAPKSSNWRRALASSRALFKSFGTVALERYLAEAARWMRWPLVHEPDTCPITTSTPTVTTVQDLSVVLHPEWHPPHRVAKFARKFERGLTNARMLITSAESIRQEVIEHFGIAPERVRVAPLAPRRQFRRLDSATITAVCKQYHLPDQFLLFVGTIEPRKNLETLLRSYARLDADLRSRHQLVLVGGWGWQSESVREMLKQHPWSECVRWLGYVQDGDLVALMNAARLLVYPSLYEGFGLPPLEAMACGTAVVTTHRGGLKEAVGNAACIVEPEDEVALAQNLKLLLNEPERIDALREAGDEQVLKFTWHNTARATADAYRKAA